MNNQVPPGASAQKPQPHMMPGDMNSGGSAPGENIPSELLMQLQQI